jgi:hypothetical protein
MHWHTQKCTDQAEHEKIFRIIHKLKEKIMINHAQTHKENFQPCTTMHKYRRNAQIYTNMLKHFCICANIQKGAEICKIMYKYVASNANMPELE